MVWFKHNKVAQEVSGDDKAKEFFEAKPVIIAEQLNGGPEFKHFYKGVDPSYYNAFGSAVGMYTNVCTYR
jgi:hypothetical protein